MNESSVWGCSRRQVDSTGVTNGLFSTFYFHDVKPLDGSRVSILLLKGQRFEKTECTSWAVPRHLPPLLTPTQPKVMSHFLSSIFQEQPSNGVSKGKKIKSVSGQESACLLHTSNVPTQADDTCILKVWSNSLFINFIAFHSLGGWGYQGTQQHQNKPRSPMRQSCLTREVLR